MTSHPVKIYVDGFHLDTIDLPEAGEDILTAAMTPKIKQALQEEGRAITKAFPVPQIKPRLIILESKER